MIGVEERSRAAIEMYAPGVAALIDGLVDAIGLRDKDRIKLTLTLRQCLERGSLQHEDMRTFDRIIPNALISFARLSQREPSDVIRILRECQKPWSPESIKAYLQRLLDENDPQNLEGGL